MNRSDASDTVDAVFDAFGGEGSYDGVDALLILWRPGQDRDSFGFAVGGMGLADAKLCVLARTREVEAPESHHYFELDGRFFGIGEDAPRAKDTHGLVWCCAVTECGDPNG